MSIYEAIILGIVQGLTEFLPISSSGHLILFQNLLGTDKASHLVLFDLVCHLGTLFAILFFYHEQIRDLISNKKQKLLQILLATLPLFPLVLVIKDLKKIFDHPQYLGFFFLITAFVIFLETRFNTVKSVKQLEKDKWKDSLIIGITQAAAIFPGISRSGSTISAAKILGWSKESAVFFSFLIAIPAIMGGTVLELYKSLNESSNFASTNMLPFVVGFTTSFFSGYLALHLLSHLVKNSKFSYFAIYCILLSMISFYLFY